MLSSCLQPCQCAGREKQQLTKVQIGISGKKQRTYPFSSPPGGAQRCVAVSAAATGHLADAAAYTGPQAILDRYHALLHEYRQHKSALADWLRSVTHTKHRPAQLLDAEATGDAALVSRFQQYLMIRKRLMAEIPLMREQLEEAEQQAHSHKNSSSSSNQQLKRHHNSSSIGSYGVVNANQASSVSRSQAVGQFFAAVNYRNKNSVRDADTSSNSSNGTTGPLSASVAAAVERQPSLATAVAAPAGVAEVAAASSGSYATSSSNSSSKHTCKESSSSSNDKAEALSHLLSASSNSSSASPASSRATSAALAALAYKKQKQSGAAVSPVNGQQQQRPLAIQLIEPPPPPPGYAANSASSNSSSSSDVIGVVETARGDVNALRSNRRLDSDVSLEATLQGVPGGLGAADDTAMFAATIITQATEPITSGSNSSSDGSAPAGLQVMDPVLAAAAAANASGSTTEPVGEVVTARFDVYQGRNRTLDVSALDEYFASLAEGHNMQLAAAVSTTNSTTQAADAASDGKQQLHQQKVSSAAVGGSRNDDSSGPLVSGLCLPGDVMPLPT